MDNTKFNMSPLQLMQRLYHSYNTKNETTTFQNQEFVKNRKANHTVKLTKFLNQQEILRTNSISLPKTSTQYTGTAQSQSQSITPHRYRSADKQISKRCYFKNSYTESHPLLLSQHSLVHKEVDESKNMKTEPIEALMSTGLFHNYKLMAPHENRNSVNEIKEKMIKIKNHKRDRMEKLRYNYLISNEFKPHRISEEGNSMNRTRTAQANTKERIFPNSSQTH